MQWSPETDCRIISDFETIDNEVDNDIYGINDTDDIYAMILPVRQQQTKKERRDRQHKGRRGDGGTRKPLTCRE